MDSPSKLKKQSCDDLEKAAAAGIVASIGLKRVKLAQSFPWNIPTNGTAFLSPKGI